MLSIILPACEMTASVWQFEHSLALPFLGTGIKVDLFLSFSGSVGTAEFSKVADMLTAALEQHHLAGS